MIVQCGNCKKKMNVVIAGSAVKNPVVKCPQCGTINRLKTVAEPKTPPATEAGWLVLESPGPKQFSKYALYEGKNIVGRKSATGTAAIQIEADDKTISRQHITITITPDKKGQMEYLINDNNSANGTHINGKQLLPGFQLYLNHNDKIQLGQTIVIFKTPYISATQQEESKTIINDQEQKTIIV